MIDALTIDDIEEEINKSSKGDYIALVLLCRYRNDPQSVPWRIAVNGMNFHYQSGPNVNIYVPGFSFFGKTGRSNLGVSVRLENSDPLGYYYPKVSSEAYDFIRKRMKGLNIGSSVSLIALDVKGNKPNWHEGVVMDLSKVDINSAEEKFMEVIDACKVSAGHIQIKDARFFKKSYRLENLVSYLSENGWTIVSTLASVGSLVLSPK